MDQKTDNPIIVSSACKQLMMVGALELWTIMMIVHMHSASTDELDKWPGKLSRLLQSRESKQRDEPVWFLRTSLQNWTELIVHIWWNSVIHSML